MVAEASIVSMQVRGPVRLRVAGGVCSPGHRADQMRVGAVPAWCSDPSQRPEKAGDGGATRPCVKSVRGRPFDGVAGDVRILGKAAFLCVCGSDGIQWLK